MKVNMPNRVSFSTAMLAVLLFAGQPSAAPASRTLRGYIVDVLSNGSFRLENNATVTISPTTAIVGEGQPHAGQLVVGLEVEVTGHTNSTSSHLQAEKIAVLTDFEEEVEGSAVVEERQETSEGTVLAADGRKLLITSRTRFLPANQKELATVPGKDSLQRGIFLHYRGRGTEQGWIELEELSAWPNRLEDQEQQIYQTYEPEMLLPKEKGTAPAVLKIGKNRYAVLEAPEVQLYLDRLGTRLLPPLWAATEPGSQWGYRFGFIVVLHERPQASAFPGGMVVVHTGLFRLVENEAQLAFAIAHEIAHVTQEHAWREYLYHRRKLALLRWSTAGIGYVVESAIRRGYQRDLEAQADRLALRYVTQAGYDPREGLKFLRRLEENQEGLSALLWDTHRSYGQRRKALMRGLAHYSVGGLDYGSLSSTSPEFALCKAKIPTAKFRSVRRAGGGHK